jgi:hypothetical protein
MDELLPEIIMLHILAHIVGRDSEHERVLALLKQVYERPVIEMNRYWSNVTRSVGQTSAARNSSRSTSERSPSRIAPSCARESTKGGLTRARTCTRHMSCDLRSVYRAIESEKEGGERKGVEASVELVFEELNVLGDVLVGPLPCRKIFDEGQELGDEHGGQVLCRGLCDEVLHMTFPSALSPSRREKERTLTRKVAMMTRMTFSLPAFCAILVKSGTMSNFLR